LFVTRIKGSGTYSDWVVSLSGPAGAPPDAYQVLHVRDSKSSGSAGGDATIGLQTRTLNTVVTNTIPGASLAANAITLPAGTYDVIGSVPAYQCSGHQAYLYSTTAAADVAGGTGTGETSDTTSGPQTRSLIMGRITLTSTQTIVVRHAVAANKLVSGLGIPGAIGKPEIFTDLKFTKVPE
jgi:hypothetical protein